MELLKLESLETTYASKEKGGNYKEDLIEEITQLAEEHLNFSHQSRLGGYHVVAGSGWTTGGIVASTSGLPLIIPLTTQRFQRAAFSSRSICFGGYLKERRLSAGISDRF